MATASGNLSEEQFLCSICLDVFTQPVSLSCGHNFCKTCITDCWNSTTSGLCQCPMCKETFNRRPELHVNCFISEMADHFRKSVQVKDESRMCKKHNKILELFCREEQKCICIFCLQTDHRSHDVVALADESGNRKEEMGKGKTQLEQKIQEREQKLQDIRRSAELNKEVAEKETADGVEVVIALVASIQKRLAEIFEVINWKQKEVQQEAELLITELQQEITELQMTCMECEKLSRSQDHLQVLMYSLPSPPSSPPCSDWSKVLMDNKLCAGTVKGAVTKMEKTLNEGMEALIKQMKEHHRPRPPKVPPRKGK